MSSASHCAAKSSGTASPASAGTGGLDFEPRALRRLGNGDNIMITYLAQTNPSTMPEAYERANDPPIHGSSPG